MLVLSRNVVLVSIRGKPYPPRYVPVSPLCDVIPMALLFLLLLFFSLGREGDIVRRDFIYHRHM